MIHKRFLTTLLFLIFAVGFWAQNPGYQGKHLVASYGVSGMPLVGSIFTDDEPWDFNLRHTIRLEYAVLRNVSLGVFFEQVNDITYLTNYSASGQSPIDELINGWNGNSVSEFQSAANFHGINYGIAVRFYRYHKFGSIAPLGSFLNLEYMYNDLKISDDGRYFNNNQKDLHELSSHTFVLGTGIQHIFYNRFTFDISINIGINNKGRAVTRYGEQIFGTSDQSDIDDDGFFFDQELKLFSDYLLFTRVGVGYLLY